MKKLDKNKPIKKELISVLDYKTKEWNPYLNVKEFIDFVNPVEGVGILERISTKMYVQKLPFYNDGSLLRVETVVDGQNFSLFYLNKEDEFIVLNGMSAHIYEFNEFADIKLTEGNVLDYLKFFCVFLDNPENNQPYYIIEEEQSEFIKAWSQYDKKRALKNFKPTTVELIKEDGSFKIISRVLHGVDVFDSEFVVYSNGKVEMLNDIFVNTL